MAEAPAQRKDIVGVPINGSTTLRGLSSADVMNLNDMLKSIFYKMTGHMDGDDMEDGTITGTQIAELTIGTAHIADAIITTAKIAELAVTGAKIAAATIETANIKDAAITNALIANLAVDAAKIALATITAAQIANATITNALIVDATITGAKIALATIENANIKDATIEHAKIKSVSATTISTGTLNSSLVLIQGTDGRLILDDNLIKVIDASGNTRVKMGDVNEDGTLYGLKILGADGTTALFNETGITTDGIPDGTITYDTLEEYLQNRIDFVSGGAAVYYQVAEPTGGTYHTGDIWFDTNDSYKAYKYSETTSTWVLQSADAASFLVGQLIAKMVVAGVVTADVIQAGTMSADRISGGTLMVGTAGAARSEMYSSGGSPLHRYYDASNVLRRSDTPDGIYFYDALGIASVKLATTTANATITVGVGKDFETIQEAIDSLPMFINHFAPTLDFITKL